MVGLHGNALEDHGCRLRLIKKLQPIVLERKPDLFDTAALLEVDSDQVFLDAVGGAYLAGGLSHLFDVQHTLLRECEMRGLIRSRWAPAVRVNNTGYLPPTEKSIGRLGRCGNRGCTDQQDSATEEEEEARGRHIR